MHTETIPKCRYLKIEHICDFSSIIFCSKCPIATCPLVVVLRKFKIIFVVRGTGGKLKIGLFNILITLIFLLWNCKTAEIGKNIAYMLFFTEVGHFYEIYTIWADLTWVQKSFLGSFGQILRKCHIGIKNPKF